MHAGIGADFQVDHAVVAEGFDGPAGMGVEFDQPIAGRDIEDALIAIAVGPIGHAAARKLARRERGAQAFIHAIDPFQFAGLGIQRDHVAARAGGGIDRAVDLDRRAFQLEFRTCAQIVGLEMPGQLQLVEVGGVDLVLRRIARSRRIGEIHRPIALGGRRRVALRVGGAGNHKRRQRNDSR